MAITQRVFQTAPQVGYPGRLALPSAPHLLQKLELHVPSGGTNGKAGYAVFWNNNEDAVEVADAAGDVDNVIGVISPQLTDVATGTLASVPHNQASELEYTDGALVDVVVDGVTWAITGVALEYGAAVEWDPTNLKWVALTQPGTWTQAPKRVFASVYPKQIAIDGMFMLYASGFIK